MIYFKSEINGCLLGVWRIDESNKDLRACLNNNDEIEAKYLNDKIRSADSGALAVRVLLKELLGQEQHILYLKSGKPYLKNGQYKLSISHTTAYVAVLLHKTRDVGVDIEQFSDQVKRIRERFVASSEYINPNKELVHLLLHWCAKESLYKILNKEGLSFQNELSVNRFEPESKGEFEAVERITNEQKSFKINYIVDPNFVLTMAVD